jgi:FkbM family methyltransferase
VSAWKKIVSTAVSALGFELVGTPDNRVGVERHQTLGRDHIRDIQTILGAPPRCIFDVGAHIGQTAKRFATAFPAADIYSFEPDPRSYAALEATARALPRVHPFHAALGARTGEATLFRNVYDQTNSLLPNAAGAAEFALFEEYLRPAGTEQVPITTIDAFCAEHGIRAIDVLKMDVQGYELEVLRGAAETLSGAAIPLIYTEVSFIRYYEAQPLFQHVYEFLYALDYRMVGIYESGYLTHYYQVGGNALFVHASRGQRKPRAPFFRLGRVELRR